MRPLFFVGDRDPPEQYPAKAFAAAAGGPAGAQIIPGCYHFHTKTFGDIAARVTGRLAAPLQF